MFFFEFFDVLIDLLISEVKKMKKIREKMVSMERFEGRRGGFWVRWRNHRRSGGQAPLAKVK